MKNRKKFSLQNKKSLILFELFYKATFLIIIIPLFQWILKITLRVSKFSYLTIENISVYLRNPFTIFMIIFLLLLIGIVTLIEIISLIIYFFDYEKKKNILIKQVLFPGLIRIRQLFQKKSSLLLPWVAIFIELFIILPIIISMLARFRIPSYVINLLLKNQNVYILIMILSLPLLALVFSGVFTLHFCTLKGMNIKEAFISSIKLQRGNRLEIIKRLVVCNIILLIIYYLLYYGVLLISAFIIRSIVDESLINAVFLTIYDQVNIIVGMFLVMISSVTNIGLLTKMFLQFQEKQKSNLEYEIEKIQENVITQDDFISLEISNDKLPQFKGGYQLIIRVISAFVLIICILFVYNHFKYGSLVAQQTLFGVYITAHRGASALAPENTIPAIEYAISNLADYVEIDVQETKDGVVVLMHDKNIKRTTNGTGDIWDINYIDLMQLDAGSWFSNEFKGTRIPTLEETLRLCQGNILVNIEIKTSKNSPMLVDRVVKIVEDNNFARYCVISSSNQEALVRVKELNPEIKTGYIMALAYGNFYGSEYADFFSIKSSFINETMVKMAHSLGKEIHAWTVNSESEMERMKKMGVDNIITDYPVLAREIVYGENRKSLNSILRLVNY